ncbi:MAG: hypothetical protein GY842_07280 [bacterium]|nr:hypothetical protein [bacterium]
MKRAFLLMEVVIAVSILVVGMAFIGMQVQNSSRAAARAERTMRTLLLAESKFAEFDSGLIIPEDEIEEEFGPLFPDYGWRLLIEPHPTTLDLNQITLQILYQPRQDISEQFDFDEAQVVHRLYTLRVTPQPIDLTRDFGMDEEQADDLAEQLGGVTEGGLDPRALSPAIFAELSLEELLEVAPPLLEAFGMSIGDLMNVLPEELRQALEEAQAESEDSEGEGASDSASGSAGESTESGTGGGRTSPRTPRRRRGPVGPTSSSSTAK